MVNELVSWCAPKAGGRELLRVYWYDAAINRLPRQDQRGFAELPDVKLRLGRMVGGRQKGVDALLLLDLVTLAGNQAADVFFLFAGDEDLSEGVQAAQARGARLLLMTIAGREASVAATMRDEADGLLLLSTERLAPHISRAGHRIDAGGDQADVVPTPALPPAAGQMPAQIEDLFGDGVRFGREWLAATEIQDWAAVLRVRPWIPSEVDAQLLREVSGGRDLVGWERNSAREGFWAAMLEGGAPDVPDHLGLRGWRRS